MRDPREERTRNFGGAGRIAQRDTGEPAVGPSSPNLLGLSSWEGEGTVWDVKLRRHPEPNVDTFTLLKVVTEGESLELSGFYGTSTCPKKFVLSFLALKHSSPSYSRSLFISPTSSPKSVVSRSTWGPLVCPTLRSNPSWVLQSRTDPEWGRVLLSTWISPRAGQCQPGEY